MEGNTLHIITPVEDAEKIYEQICACDSSPKETVMLDLSVGDHINLTSQKMYRDDDPHRKVRLVDGQQFASKVGDKSRETYLEWLSESADQSLSGGTSIKEKFTYCGETSLWWFTPSAEKHSEAHPYRWMFYMLAVIDQAVQEFSESFSEAHIWTGKAAVRDALKKALLRHGLTVRIHWVEGRGNTWADEKARPSEQEEWFYPWRILQGAWRLLVNTVRLLRGVKFFWTTLWDLRATNPVSSEKDLVLLQTHFPKSWRSRSDYDDVNAGVQSLDHYFGDAPWRLRKEGIQLAWLPTVNYYNYDEWVKKSRRHPFDSALPWMTISISQAVNLLWHQLIWLLNFCWLFGVRKLHSEWKYKEIPLGKVLFDEYWSLCVEGEGMMRMLEVERYRTACHSLCPDAIIYRDEFYRSGRAVTTGAGQGTLRVGVQHGLLSREDTVYQFNSSDLPLDLEERSNYVRYCPVPDRIVGFGDYVTEQFEQWGGYDADNVIPFGGIRHDALIERYSDDQADSSIALRTRLGLPEEQPIVLLCPGRSHGVEPSIEMVLRGLREASLCAFIVVKLHQYHGGEDYIHRVAERYDVTSYAVLYENVYPLLSCADVLVAVTSTLTVEACLLRTPIISIVAHPEYELYPFTEEGIAHTVSNVEEMADALRNTLESQSMSAQDDPSPKRGELLRRHLNNKDANACGRLAKWLRIRTRDK